MKTTKNKPVSQVFINCPFDPEFRSLFRTLVFTICYLDHYPVFVETKSSIEFRLRTILGLIRSSKIGMHDLSRHKSTNAGEFSRFNLPFELGLDMGSNIFGGCDFNQKKIIVLDHAEHDYDSYIGDLSGQDIIIHKGDPRTLMNEIRNWFSRIYQHKILPGTELIWRTYLQFIDDIQINLETGWSKEDLEQMQLSEYRKYAIEWIQLHENEERNR